MKPEQALQIACVQWMRLRLAPDVVFFHVPNGGARSAREGAIFKAMGVMPGVPDLVITWPDAVAGVELKAGRGRVSPAQAAMMARLQAVGWHIAEARSVDELSGLLIGWGCPMGA